ncbi:MAG: D-aminoacyl-tRNA deacylase [bacterium]
MIAVVQKVKYAKYLSSRGKSGKINYGLLVYLGISHDDTKEIAAKIISKIVNCRLFDQADKNFEKSLLEIKGEIMIVSQFTLYADTNKGRRPSFSQALNADKAKLIFEQALLAAQKFPVKVVSGDFQQIMDIEYVNHGPVTIIFKLEQ